MQHLPSASPNCHLYDIGVIPLGLEKFAHTEGPDPRTRVCDTAPMDFGPNVHVPHSVYLDDGRMLWWLHRASDDDVQRFRIAGADVADGLALLAAAGVGRDGRPLVAVGPRLPVRTSAGDLSESAGWRALQR